MKFNVIAFTWLSSLKFVDEENQFYVIKKEKHLIQLICD